MQRSGKEARSHEHPAKVLITGSSITGGVDSFAEALYAGFAELGIPSEVLAPLRIFSRRGDLRDPRILKILSTSAVYAAPFARRTVCMAHGVPRADFHGWRKMLGIVASFKLANLCSGVQLVSVSHYTAVTLRTVFNVRIDAVIHNPVKPLYLEKNDQAPRERCYITYMGRLIAPKNAQRIIPAIRDLLNETPGLRACIIGEGELRPVLEKMVEGDSRFEFKGRVDDHVARECLRQTKVFVSGNEVEGFGITYLEAMTQGCVVVMPAGGGGIEIAPDRVGGAVQLLPLSWNRGEVLAALRRALNQTCSLIDTDSHSLAAVATAYLLVDAGFSQNGLVTRN
jgi:glycosyltransferase involved in cell wall biosynthesis